MVAFGGIQFPQFYGDCRDLHGQCQKIPVGMSTPVNRFKTAACKTSCIRDERLLAPCEIVNKFECGLTQIAVIAAGYASAVGTVAQRMADEDGSNGTRVRDV